MATLAEANRVSRELSGGKVKFSSVSSEAVRGSSADTWIQHINKFQPILFSLGNHCRILAGYNGLGQLIIFDPAKASDTQPEPMGIGVFSRTAADVWVMD